MAIYLTQELISLHSPTKMSSTMVECPTLISGSLLASSHSQWYIAGSGAGLQTVEGDWIVYPIQFNNTKKPVLFVYSTPDNYGPNQFRVSWIRADEF